MENASSLSAKRKFLAAHLPAFLMAVLILTVSSIPRLQAPSIGIELEDKAAHFFEYSIFSILVYRSLAAGRKSRREAFLLTIMFMFVFGAADELHQKFIPGRFAEVLDFIADVSGAVSGVILFHFLNKHYLMRK
ncbi:VanZ family protein [bacterium]|nr:VanZ family protein [bacterium]